MCDTLTVYETHYIKLAASRKKANFKNNVIIRLKLILSKIEIIISPIEINKIKNLTPKTKQKKNVTYI